VGFEDLPDLIEGDTLFQGYIIAVARSLPRVASAFVLIQKNQKIKAKDTLLPTGHTPVPQPFAGAGAFLIFLLF